MLAYLERAIFAIMGQPLIMGLWVALTTMLYLLQKRAHMYRAWGTIRLFATSGIMGVVLPLATWLLGWVLHNQLMGTTRTAVVILSVPVIIVIAFALAVTLIQRFMGADAETALALSWPITAIAYVVPLVFCFLLSLGKQTWLTGADETPY